MSRPCKRLEDWVVAQSNFIPVSFTDIPDPELIERLEECRHGELLHIDETYKDDR